MVSSTTRRHIVDYHFTVNKKKKSAKRIVTTKPINIVRVIVTQATGGKKNESIEDVFLSVI